MIFLIRDKNGVGSIDLRNSLKEDEFNVNVYIRKDEDEYEDRDEEYENKDEELEDEDEELEYECEVKGEKLIERFTFSREDLFDLYQALENMLICDAMF